ncbi:IclR family transcriptional regulator [Trinickia caryophylli]|uniref:Transcriptional regulator, IclR family n=1 Tax=Trinickia caryophylli TaxID=28094 RepID=A0A1X7DY06_TRICW|nr:IclR family transcriptional regulator [Trinickia caryophylli]WQE11363.1 IclR family transcriptional regulator [Trinickia caryophylli]GLU32521.1 IclR family transcriptional regulator [Trinickia caryophylli]SMF23620.1 transcriptional regulator, IclR family [Trinickia caryophylli]
MPSPNRKPAPPPKTIERDGAPEEVAALARGLTVLRAVAAADAPISNRELAEVTRIPKPTVSRLTATLVGAGFLYRLPDSERFVLTAAVLELSNGFLRNFDIRARARPFLVELAEKTSLSVHLATRDRLDMVVIETIRPRSAILVSRLEIGSRMDLTRTAVGRAYLGVLAEPERDALMSGLQAAAGDDWPHIHARLAPALAETQANGYAIATGEWYEGLNAIAAGFVGPSGERYAVNCGGAAHLCPREWLIEHAAPALVACVAQIVREIGGAPRLRLRD